MALVNQFAAQFHPWSRFALTTANIALWAAPIISTSMEENGQKKKMNKVDRIQREQTITIWTRYFECFGTEMRVYYKTLATKAVSIKSTNHQPGVVPVTVAHTNS